MERLVKTISFTPEQWTSIDFQKGDLAWISEEQSYVHEAIENHLPLIVPATISIIEDVYRDTDRTIYGASIYSIINGKRGEYGIYKGDIVRNLTHDYKRYFAARKIQCCFRKYRLRKQKILHALSILQPIAREWYVNPNNPNHQKRMRKIAEKWGMRP